MKIDTLEQALIIIKQLEDENAKLRLELEEYKNRKYSGRKKHNDKWMAAFEDFAKLYDSGMTIMEIVDHAGISRRTAYRYKAYYDELHNHSKKDE